MADLDNLLDEINDNDNVGINYGDERQQQQPSSPNAAESESDEIDATRSQRGRRPVGDDDFGAGDEERDYQAISAAAAQGGMPGAGGDDDGMDGEEDEGEGDGRNLNPEYEQLRGLWTSELACPELLPHDADTVLDAEELARQEEVVDDLLRRSKRQPQRRGEGASGEVASLVAQLTRMDLDRTRFMMVDLARTRMAKIENHALHNRTLLDRMTEEETAYLRQYGELLEKHYRRTVLDHLTKKAWKSLDEPEMIDSPDLEQFVFCRVLEPVKIDVRGNPNNLGYDDLEKDDEDDEFGDTVQDHYPGSYLIVMYKTVKDLVLDGKVELLI